MPDTPSNGSALIVLGVITAAIVLSASIGTYRAVQSHETTDAEILSTGVEAADEFADTEYYPRVTYEYTVDGTTYNGTRIFHPSQIDNDRGDLDGREFDSRAAAENIVEAYADGDTVRVHYDPRNPDFSYLRHPVWENRLRIAGGVLLGTVMAGWGLFRRFGPIRAAE